MHHPRRTRMSRQSFDEGFRGVLIDFGERGRGVVRWITLLGTLLGTLLELRSRCCGNCTPQRTSELNLVIS